MNGYQIVSEAIKLKGLKFSAIRRAIRRLSNPFQTAKKIRNLDKKLIPKAQGNDKRALIAYRKALKDSSAISKEFNQAKRSGPAMNIDKAYSIPYSKTATPEAKKKAYLWMRLYDKLSLNNDMIYRGSEVAKKVARA